MRLGSDLAVAADSTPSLGTFVSRRCGPKKQKKKKKKKDVLDNLSIFKI